MLAMYNGQIGSFSSRDLLLFFIMWELELIPVYLLLSMWGGKKRLYSATKFILYTAVGSIFLLMRILGVGLYGVGKWILKLMKDFFVDVAENEEIIQKGEKNKGSKPYMPQKNSVAYALLITLYRGTTDGTEFMRKQELIDAAEASGLSRSPIMPEIGKGKAGQFGVSSGRDWYSGWSCMKKLIDKGLVVKSSCPAK
ncbi:putative NADH:quinone oxidoreductase/Mrp antiporter, membrane subunit [Helianthus debilis subsp. tardiflorus]